MLSGVVRAVGAACLCGLVLGLFSLALPVDAQEKKKEKDPNEGKKGKTIGVLVKKTDKSIDVKADGEEKARTYVPEWRGGAPAQGGGFDKEILKLFQTLKVGSRVEVEWVFHERFRALAVKVIAPPKDEKK